MKFIMTLFWVFSICLLESQNIHSAEPDCSNASNTIEINQCYLKQYENVDAHLNAVYQNLVKMVLKVDEYSLPGVKGKMIKELRNAQRKWIDYRDANCSFHYSLAGGGSMAGMKNIQCKIRMTESRRQDFVKVLNEF